MEKSRPSVFDLSQGASLRKGKFRIMRTSAGIFLLAVFVLSWTVSIYAQEALWNELTNEVLRLYQQGRYSEADKVGEEALIVAEKASGPRMRISIILLKTKTEAHRVLQKLGAGADFAELAGQYSIGPGKEEGGDMGFFAPGDLVEELNAVALGLKIGEYSGIVETSKGYFILMKTDEKSPSELVAAQTQEKLWNELNSKCAMLYRQGRYPEATKVAEEALTIAEKTFGPDHPAVATSLNNLAALYTAQGKYSEAEFLHKRALAIDEKALGKDHPGVATDLNNLAAVYQAQGKYSEAEPLYKRALGIVEKALGKNHPHVATTCENMAELYRQIGEEDEAEKLEARARRIRSKR